MTTLQKKAAWALRPYRRKGGKANRRVQATRAIRFIRFCESQGARHPGQIGPRTVNLFVAKLRQEGLAERTIYAYRLAIQELLNRLQAKP